MENAQIHSSSVKSLIRSHIFNPICRHLLVLLKGAGKAEELTSLRHLLVMIDECVLISAIKKSL